MTPPLGARVRFRARAERILRDTFDAVGLTEITVPSLVENPGLEPHLRAFHVRAAHALEVDGRALHTSPEYAIKAVLAEIGTDVFTLARTYRDEPPGRWHHPEFTMVEWYRIGAPWTALMEDCETLVRALVDGLADAESPSRALVAAPFERRTVAGLFAERVGAPPTATPVELHAALTARGVSCRPDWDWETLFTVAYAERIEASLTDRPTFVTEFPAAMAALARLRADDPSVAERFELYLPTADGGVELANAFGELVDAGAQRARFQADLDRRRADGATVYPMPERMLAGLDALGPTSGIALGWERLLCWLASQVHGWDTGVADWLTGEPPVR